MGGCWGRGLTSPSANDSEAQQTAYPSLAYPILSRGSDCRCTCSVLLVHAYGLYYSTVPPATPSSGPPGFLLSLPQARPGTQWHNWELVRLGSLAFVGSQSRRRKNLITTPPPLSYGRLGRDKGCVIKP